MCAFHAGSPPSGGSPRSVVGLSVGTRFCLSSCNTFFTHRRGSFKRSPALRNLELAFIGLVRIDRLRLSHPSYRAWSIAASVHPYGLNAPGLQLQQRPFTSTTYNTYLVRSFDQTIPKGSANGKRRDGLFAVRFIPSAVAVRPTARYQPHRGAEVVWRISCSSSFAPPREHRGRLRPTRPMLVLHQPGGSCGV